MGSKGIILDLQPMYIRIVCISIKFQHIEYESIQTLDNPSYYKSYTPNKNKNKNIETPLLEETQYQFLWAESSSTTKTTEEHTKELAEQTFNYTTYNGVILESLCQWLQDNYPKVNSIYFNVIDPKVYLREFSYPFTERKKINKVLSNEIGLALSISTNEVITETYFNTHDNSTDIITISTEEDILEKAILVFKRYSYQVKSIYSFIDALYQISLTQPEKSKCVLSFNYHSSILLVSHNNKVIYARTLSASFSKIIQQIMLHLRVSFTKAHEVWNSLYFNSEGEMQSSLKDCSSKELNQIKFIQNTFHSQVHLEVQKSLYLLDNNEEINIQEFPFYILTGFSNVRLMESLFTDKFSFYVLPFSLVNLSVPSFINTEDVLLCGVAKSVSENKINFLTKKLKKLSLVKKNKHSFIEWGVASLFISSILSFIISISLDYHILYKKANILLQQNKEYYSNYFKEFTEDTTLSLIEQANTLIENKENKLSINKKYSGDTISQTLVDLNDILLDFDISLEALSFTRSNNYIKISGTVSDYETFNNVKQVLKTSGHYEKDIKQSNVKETVTTALAGKVRFTLSFTLKKESS